MNFIKSKNGLLTGIIYLVLFGVFNMLAFLIPFDRNEVFWISYAFICLAFILQIAGTLETFRNLGAKAVFYGIPLFSLSIFYFIAEIFVGFIFMIFTQAPLTIVIMLQAILLAGYVIVAILAVMARDNVKSMDDNIRRNVLSIRMLQADIDYVASVAADGMLKAKLSKLSEAVRYSDPMSNDAVADVERDITNSVASLRVTVECGKTDEALQMCEYIQMLLSRRNQILMATK